MKVCSSPLLLCILAVTSALHAAGVRYVNDGTAAIVPAGASLVFTPQVFAADPASAHTAASLALRLAKADDRSVARLHVAARSVESAQAAVSAIRKHHPAGRDVPITLVVGELSETRSEFALDAVAVSSRPTTRTTAPSPASLLFIAGQAQKGATPAEAAASTVASLLKTLEFAGAGRQDVLHARCFLAPVRSAAQVTGEIEKVFGANKVPIAYVEWRSSPDLPVEIELVARCPAPQQADPPPIEYLTQPGATPSPLFSRIARVNRGDLIFTGGLFSSETGGGEQQVLSAFSQLEKLVTDNGSDLRHLVKATYYVSDNDASGKLNVLRPKFYDPKRPPSASKAVVPGVGMNDRSFTMDMIAVTAPKP